MDKLNYKNLAILILSIFFLIFAGLLNEKLIKPQIIVSKQDSAINLNSNFLKFFNLGQSRLIADILWIVTLLESDIKHYKKKDLNSWMYLRFKSIAILDPLFLQNYQFGGKYLSIIKDDILGAKELFDQALNHYPNDYELLFNAAYLYAFELNDNLKGYELYSKILDFPQTPLYIKTLTLKLKYENNKDLSFAYKLLTETLSKERDPYIIKKIETDLYAIKAQIDLKCLNKVKKSCSTLDYYGNKYLLTNGKFQAPLKFKPYGLKRSQ